MNDDEREALRDYLAREALRHGDPITALALKPDLVDKVSRLMSECLGKPVKIQVREVG